MSCLLQHLSTLGKLLGKAERYSRSGRLVKSLDVSIEIGVAQRCLVASMEY
jgi:hypothetical protein